MNKDALKPTALSVDEAAKLLSTACGLPITVAMLQTDMAAGVPVNADGTLNLVVYAAWLIREMDRGD